VAEPIEIGFGTNIQDGVTIHVDAEFPVSVGAGVSVGHNAVLHGCVVEDDSLIGMGAVILNGAYIGKGCLIAAGALVPQGVVVPPGSLVTGVPGSVRRDLSDAETASNRHNAQVYQRLIELHRNAIG
jgi:carbonic anhydrase/acetyltransferase-like protein (isoleucine patch superfamily)